ncbi:TldD/PmbA family protein [Coprothermobacter platensis]|uniref:TldD/PmbA family protein n=1 Tax=Coprothermobacter platensis TaxID=108819 RepID=UPI000365113D|nr:metallopeptidase TldD-related protein [Coprothermobacter platensis]
MEFSTYLPSISEKYGQGDIFYMKEETERVRLSGSDWRVKVEDSSLSHMNGYGVRVIRNGQIGFSYGNKMTDDEMQKTISNSAQCALIGEKSQLMLPGSEGEQISEAQSNVELASLAYQISGVLLSKGIKTFDIISKRVLKNWELFNTNEGHVRSEEQVYYFEVDPVVTGKKSNTSFWLNITGNPQSLNEDELVGKALDRAYSSLDGVKANMKDVPVVFDSPEWSQIWLMLLNAFSGANVGRGMSFFTHKENSQVVAKNASLVLCGEHPCIPQKYCFDQEGTPIDTTYLMKDGMFLTPYYSLASAAQFNKRPTGVGYRESFRNEPSEQPFIVHFEVSSTQPIESLDKYVLITFLQGIFSGGLNSLSGNFSLGASGVLVDKGEHIPLSGITLSGNIWDALKQIVATSKEETAYPIGIFPNPTGPWFVSPLVALDGITVSG